MVRRTDRTYRKNVGLALCDLAREQMPYRDAVSICAELGAMRTQIDIALSEAPLWQSTTLEHERDIGIPSICALIHEKNPPPSDDAP